MKQAFASNSFAAWAFRCGAFRGIGAVVNRGARTVPLPRPYVADATVLVRPTQSVAIDRLARPAAAEVERLSRIVES